MSADKGGSKADALVKGILVAFIALLAFSIGTFVGKQVSDSDHRRAALEGEYQGRSVASTETYEETSSEKISEKELEGLTEEFESKERVAVENAEHGAVAHSSGTTALPATAIISQDPKSAAKPGEYKAYTRSVASTEAPTTGMKTDANQTVADKIVAGQAPTDGRPEARKPTAMLPSVANSAAGKFTVQVGSYATEDEAKNHAATLKAKGWTAFYLAADINGRTWYRVLVGLFETSKSAQEHRAQFMRDTNTKSAIVQKIVQ